MRYEVRIRKSQLKKLSDLPFRVKLKFDALVADLESRGPMQWRWPKFSKLSATTYHCHIGYNHVACWQCEKKSVIVEVYYVGSREAAPY